MKEQIRDLTPKDMQCAAAVCPAIYELTSINMRCTGTACPAIYELTPKNMRCNAVACPSIYNEVTSKDMQCMAAACPEIHEGEDNYLIIGKKVNPKEFGLEKKVGKGEVLIRVPKGLIDDIGK